MTTNPFNPFGNIDLGTFDMSKFLGDLKVPGVDLQNMLASQRKNIEALTAANQLAAKGLQEVAKRQSEFLAEAMNEMSGAAKQIASSGNPQEMSAKQGELAKQAFEKVLGNMRELAEIVSKSNSEAFTVINQRMTENLEEFKSLMANQVENLSPNK